MRGAAFTLAEVLIALGIIGVVAAITLPSVINNARNQQLKKAWKKEFSTISQVMDLIKDENGGDLSGVFQSRQDAIAKICNHLVCTKQCTRSEEQQCWHKPGEYKSPNGYNSHSRNYPGFRLNDGSIWITNTSFSSNCAALYPEGSGIRISCIDFWVDVNGFQKPNTLGVDSFRIVILRDRVIPYGAYPGNSNSCRGEFGGSSWGDDCSAKYLLE